MGKYALSSGFVQEQEDLNTAVCREVREETSVQLNTDHIEQLVTVGTPYRDPRMWTITIAYLCFMAFNDIQMDKAADDAASTHWLDIALWSMASCSLLMVTRRCIMMTSPLTTGKSF